MAKKRKKNRGVVLVTVLFVIMAITVIALGLFARTDMHLACARNFTTRTQMDALAYSGLEYARILVITEKTEPLEQWNSVPVDLLGLDMDRSEDYSDSCEYYIGSPTPTPVSDPNYIYPIQIRTIRRESYFTALSGQLFYDPHELQAWYVSIQRD